MEQKYWEHPDNGMLYGIDTYTPLGRIAFVDLVTPRAYTGNTDGKKNEPKYGVTLLIPKEMDENTKGILKKIQGEVAALREDWIIRQFKKLKNDKLPFEKFREDKIAGMGGRPFLRDGDYSKAEGFPGNYYLRANNRVRDGKTGILFLKGRVPEEFEGGMICRLQIQPMVDSQGFAFKLRAINLVQDDGFRFFKGGRTPDLLSDLDDAVEAATVNTQTPADSALMSEFDKAVAGKGAGKGSPAPTADDLAVL